MLTSLITVQTTPETGVQQSQEAWPWHSSRWWGWLHILASGLSKPSAFHGLSHREPFWLTVSSPSWVSCRAQQSCLYLYFSSYGMLQLYSLFYIPSKALADEATASMVQDNLIDLVKNLGFPGGSDGKESVCSMGDLGLILGMGRSPGGGHGNPLQYFLPGESPRTEEEAWQAIVHGVAKSQTWLSD